MDANAPQQVVQHIPSFMDAATYYLGQYAPLVAAPALYWLNKVKSTVSTAYDDFKDLLTKQNELLDKQNKFLEQLTKK